MGGTGKVVINKEETAENWCFVCKDGGDLRICDYKECLKSYHPGCVQKDESFLESEEKWDCAYHKCFHCRRSSYLHCYTCIFAVCRHCVTAGEILKIKGKYGFCKPCLKLAILIEEKRDYDSDGEKVDFTDRETCEGLFMEYYIIIKKEEGFMLKDIYAAKDRLKLKKNHHPESGSEDFDDEEEEEQISDSDDFSNKKIFRKKHKRCKDRISAKQTPVKSNKKEFIGWASRRLTEFLSSIGESTDEKLSQHDVASIVNKYVKEKNLLNPMRKRMIICDARLQSLFRKKTISRHRVRELLEDHFAENHDESEEDELAYDSEDDNESASKRPRKSEKKSEKKDVLKSRFALIAVENVKLVYLKRGVLKDMLKEPQSFEDKVTGCFVRIKSDPNDYRSIKSHRLVQVKGVKTIPTDENNTETILLFSTIPTEICVSLLSDEDFSQEECEDLKKRMLAGEIERPTVESLQQKAKAIHRDITNHSIRKELALLQNLIDRANEKGWRRELFEYLERRKKLQCPLEQTRLLENVPTVTPDLCEPDCDAEGIKYDVKSDEGSPESISPYNSPVPTSDVRQDDKVSEENTRDVSTSKKEPISGKPASKEPQQGHTPVKSEPEPDSFKQPSRLTTFEAKWNTCSEKTLVEKPTKAKCDDQSNTEVIDILSDDEDEDGLDGRANHHVHANRKYDDDVENEIWCVKGPNGERNKSSLSVLKRWSERSAYALKFEVWKEDESEEHAIPLPEVITVAFGKK